MNAYDLYTFYIEPADLKGQAHKVKVERVEVAEVFNPGRKKNEPKIILHLAGKKKALSLNKTRTGQMIALTGTPEIEKWTGVEIMIEPGKQSGKDTILIKPAPQPLPGTPAKTGEPEKQNISEDVITAYSNLCISAGLDQETRTAILRECGGDFELAFNKVSEQYKEVLM